MMQPHRSNYNQLWGLNFKCKSKGVKEMSDKIAVEKNKTDSTLGIIKLMTFQPEKRGLLYEFISNI